MDKLRPVTFKLRCFIDEKHQDKTFEGFFHIWAHRGDESGTDFFGVIETLDGKILEIYPPHIQFADRG